MNARLNLPYDPFNLQSQVYRFNNESPPTLPNVGVPQNLQYIYPVICSMVANEVSSHATKNNARTFQFNQVSANGFNNNEYATIVSSVVDMLLLYLLEQRVQSVEQIVGQCVGNAVTYHCCIQVANYPDLANLLDHRAMSEINQRLQEANILRNQILNMKNRMNNGSNIPPNTPFVNNNYQPAPNSPFAQNNGGFINQPQQQTINNYPSPFNGRSVNMPQNQQQSQQYVNNQDQPQTESKWSYLNRQQRVEQPVNQPVNQQVVQPVANVNQQPTPASPEQEKMMTKQLNTEWKPSEECLYLPAFNPNKQIFTLTRIVISGKTKLKATINQMDLHMMDRDQHSIVTSAGMASTAYIPPTFKTREEAAEKSLLEVKAPENQTISETIVDGEAEGVNLSKNWKALSFVDELMFNTKLSQRLKYEDDACTAYRNYAFVGLPFITQSANKSLLKRFSGHKTFDDLTTEMNAILTNKIVSNDTLVFVQKLDAYLTKELVKTLRSKLSVSIVIDSFIDDAVTVSTWLLNEVGELHRDAYEKYQREFILTFLSPFSDNESDLEFQLKESFVENEEEDAERLPLVLIKNCYSVTSVQINSSELNVSLPTADNIKFPGRSCMIPQTSLPVLYKFAKNLFEEADKEKEYFAHHLLVTSDDKVYELHKSIIGFQECFLINEYVK